MYHQTWALIGLVLQVGCVLVGWTPFTVCLAVQHCVRLWLHRNWRCFHFPLHSCDMSMLRCRSVSGTAIRE